MVHSCTFTCVFLNEWFCKQINTGTFLPLEACHPIDNLKIALIWFKPLCFRTPSLTSPQSCVWDCTYILPRWIRLVWWSQCSSYCKNICRVSEEWPQQKKVILQEPLWSDHLTKSFVIACVYYMIFLCSVCTQHYTVVTWRSYITVFVVQCNESLVYRCLQCDYIVLTRGLFSGDHLAGDGHNSIFCRLAGQL